MKPRSKMFLRLTGKPAARPLLPIGLASLALGLIFNWFFYGKLPGISVFLYNILVLGATFYFSRLFKKPLNKSLYWLAPVTLFFASMVFIRANPVLAFVNICLVLYLLLIVVRLAAQPKVGLQQYAITKYFELLGSMPLSIVREALRFLVRVVNYRSTLIPKASFTPIIRGILLSLPVLLIFLLLLSSADLVFKQYIDSLFTLHISEETVFRWVLVGVVSSLFAGAFALIFMPSDRPKKSSVAQTSFTLGGTESSIILGSVGLLFLFFVLIQMTYLFGGASQIASIGQTYAEYARKGFFELIAVAGISLALVLIVKKATAFNSQSQAKTFKWLGGVLIAEVMIIIVSAHMRLNLYENAYGYTTLRLWSHLFILWLAVAFMLLGVHLIKQTSEKSLAFQLCIGLLCFFGLINIINPDAFIARENIKRYEATGKIDTYYLNSLSADAAPVVSGLLDHPDNNRKNLQKTAAQILYRQKQSALGDPKHWQSANLARQQADRIFRDHAGQIEAGMYR